MKQINIELCGGILPHKTHNGDACYDLYCPEDVELKLGRQTIRLGFKMQLPHGYCAFIRSRSGYASKGMELTNSKAKHNADVLTGVVDENYRGEVAVIVHNHQPYCLDTTDTYAHPVVGKGTRIAQMQIVRVPDTEIVEVNKVDDNEDRGTNGFGSSN